MLLHLGLYSARRLGNGCPMAEGRGAAKNREAEAFSLKQSSNPGLRAAAGAISTFAEEIDDSCPARFVTAPVQPTAVLGVGFSSGTWGMKTDTLALHVQGPGYTGGANQPRNKLVGRSGSLYSFSENFVCRLCMTIRWLHAKGSMLGPECPADDWQKFERSFRPAQCAPDYGFHVGAIRAKEDAVQGQEFGPVGSEGMDGISPRELDWGFDGKTRPPTVVSTTAVRGPDTVQLRNTRALHGRLTAEGTALKMDSLVDDARPVGRRPVAFGEPRDRPHRPVVSAKFHRPWPAHWLPDRIAHRGGHWDRRSSIPNARRVRADGQAQPWRDHAGNTTPAGRQALESLQASAEDRVPPLATRSSIFEAVKGSMTRHAGHAGSTFSRQAMAYVLAGGAGQAGFARTDGSSWRPSRRCSSAGQVRINRFFPPGLTPPEFRHPAPHSQVATSYQGPQA